MSVKGNSKSVKIDTEWLKEIQALAKPHRPGLKATYTNEQDKHILAAHEHGVPWCVFAKWFKARHGFGTRNLLSERYRALTVRCDK